MMWARPRLTMWRFSMSRGKLVRRSPGGVAADGLHLFVRSEVSCPLATMRVYCPWLIQERSFFIHRRHLVLVSIKGRVPTTFWYQEKPKMKHCFSVSSSFHTKSDQWLCSYRPFAIWLRFCLYAKSDQLTLGLTKSNGLRAAFKRAPAHHDNCCSSSCSCLRIPLASSFIPLVNALNDIVIRFQIWTLNSIYPDNPSAAFWLVWGLELFLDVNNSLVENIFDGDCTNPPSTIS